MKREKLIVFYQTLLKCASIDEGVARPLPTEAVLSETPLEKVFHPFGEPLGTPPNDSLWELKKAFDLKINLSIYAQMKALLEISKAIDGHTASNEMVKLLAKVPTNLSVGANKLLSTPTLWAENSLLSTFIGRVNDSNGVIVYTKVTSDILDVLGSVPATKNSKYFALKDREPMSDFYEELVGFDSFKIESRALLAPNTYTYLKAVISLIKRINKNNSLIKTIESKTELIEFDDWEIIETFIENFDLNSGVINALPTLELKQPKVAPNPKEPKSEPLFKNKPQEEKPKGKMSYSEWAKQQRGKKTLFESQPTSQKYKSIF